MLDQYVEKLLSITKNSLLKNFTSQDIEILKKALIVKTFKKNDILFEEGDKSNSIYFILEGNVVVEKKHLNNSSFEIANLTGGALIGELAFLDNSPRTATIKCTEPVKLVEISINKLKKFKEIGEEVIQKIKFNISFYIVDKFRTLDSTYVESMQNALNAVKKQVEFGEVFVNIIVAFCISIFLNKIILTYWPNINVHSAAFSWPYLIIILLPTSVYLFYKKYDISQLGVTFIGYKEAVRDSLIYSLPVIAMLLLIRMSYDYYLVGKIFVHKPDFGGSWIFWVSYAIHSYLQEFFARGVLQQSLLNFYGNRYKTKAVVIASLCFAIVHNHFGLMAVLVVFTSGLYFGYVKLKNSNLICVTLVHFALGSATFALGFLS